MNLLRSSTPVDGSMLIRQLTTSEFRICGARTSKDMSAHSKLRVAWRYSKLHGQWRVQTISIISLTEQRILPSRVNSAEWTGKTMAIIRNQDGTKWCDYCKGQYGPKQLRGQTIASWVVIGSTGRKTFYCGNCAAEVTHWNCTCNNPKTCTKRFSFEKQLELKQPKQEEMSFTHGL